MPWSLAFSSYTGCGSPWSLGVRLVGRGDNGFREPRVHRVVAAAERASVAVAVCAVAFGRASTLRAAISTYWWSGTVRESNSVVPARPDCEAFSFPFAYSFSLRRPASVLRDRMKGYAESFKPSHMVRNRMSAIGA